MRNLLRRFLYPSYDCQCCVGQEPSQGCYCAYYDSPAPGRGPEPWRVFLRRLFGFEKPDQ